MILNEQLKCVTAGAITVAIGVNVGIDIGIGINTHHTGRSVCCGIDMYLFQRSHQRGIVIQ